VQSSGARPQAGDDCADAHTRPVLHTVYVPALGHSDVADIAPGSGIVGELDDDGAVVIDFEGNLIGSPSLARYANRVLRAAAHQAARYPTRARRVVAPDAVIAIGEYDAGEQVIRLTGPEAERELARWLGVDTLDHDELIARR
jgi:hypothetical protein